MKPAKNLLMMLNTDKKLVMISKKNLLLFIKNLIKCDSFRIQYFSSLLPDKINFRVFILHAGNPILPDTCSCSVSLS